MEIGGCVWLVVELTESPILVGILGICRSLPTIAFGPLAGVIADRVDQRRMLLITQALALLASLGLGLVVALGAVQFWHVYVEVILQASIEAFDQAARQALFPRLVIREHRAEAVTLTMMAGRIAKSVGPALGGVAIANWGVAAPFLLNAGTFPFLMLAVAWIQGVVPRSAAAGSSVRSELTEGLRYLIDHPVLSGLLKLEAVFAIFSMNPVIITIVGRDVLEIGPEAVGGLISATGIGGLIGIVLLLLVGPARRQGRFVVLCTLGYVVALVALAVSRDHRLTFLAILAGGIFDVLVSVTRQSIMQLTAPGRMRGRVMGNVRMVSGGLSQLSQTQSGALAAAIGAPLGVLAAATFIGVSAAATALGDRALWAFSLERAPSPPVVPTKPLSSG
jgi:MFS family permease